MKKKNITFKKMKLATKTSIIIGVILTAIFALLIIVNASQTKRSIEKSIDGEFAGIADQNGLMVQSIIDEASSTLSDLQVYLEYNYDIYYNLTDEERAVKKTSKVYHTEMQELSYEVEDYIINTAWSAVLNSPDIIGVGALYEPRVFDPAIEDYSLYVRDTNAENEPAISFGAYSEYSKLDYYRIPKETKTVYVSNPYEHEGKNIITISYPILHNDKVQGVIIVDIDTANFSQINTTDEKYPTMFANILTQDKLIVYDSETADAIGKNTSEFLSEKDMNELNENSNNNSDFYLETKRNDGLTHIRYFTPIEFGNQTWWAQTALEKGDLYKDVNKSIITIVIFAIASLLIIILVTAALLKKMLKPLDYVVSAASEIANGNLDIQLKSTSDDEIGILSSTFMSMADNLKAIIRDINYLLEEMANGNFRINSNCKEQYIGDYNGILAAMSDIISNLNHTLKEINAASDLVSTGSDQVSSGAQALAQGSTEQAASIQELSATISEMSNEINEAAKYAKDSNEVASQVGSKLEVGSTQMDEMTGAMTEITNTSNEIGKIIKAIDEIAFQTNILALNAAVEAARAGSAGKGFAVVADEVRNLAQKSAEAAQNTTTLIENAINAIQNGSKIAEDTATTIKDVAESTKKVIESSNKIAEASKHQAAQISQITDGIEQISTVVQTNSATAEESAAASEELNSQANSLKNSVSRFKLKEDNDITNDIEGTDDIKVTDDNENITENED